MYGLIFGYIVLLMSVMNLKKSFKKMPEIVQSNAFFRNLSIYLFTFALV